MMQTTILQPGAEGKDTYIRNTTPDANLSTSNIALVGYTAAKTNPVDRAILEFSLGSVVPGARYLDSALTLTTVANGQAGVGAHCYVVTNALYLHGQATWNSASTGNSWATAGGDFSADPNSEWTIPTSGTSIDVLITRDMLTYARNNMADRLIVLLKRDFEGLTGNSTYSFHTSEAAVEANRPKLTLNYMEAAVTYSFSSVQARASGRSPAGRRRRPRIEV